MGDRNQWLSMIEVPKGVIAELVFTDPMIMQQIVLLDAKLVEKIKKCLYTDGTVSLAAQSSSIIDKQPCTCTCMIEDGGSFDGGWQKQL